MDIHVNNIMQNLTLSGQLYHVVWSISKNNPNGKNRVKINIDTSWKDYTKFSVIQAWVVDDDAYVQPDYNAYNTLSVVVNWNQSSSVYVKESGGESDLSSELFVLPFANNQWVNYGFDYSKTFSSSTTYLEFWLTSIKGEALSIATDSPWEFHLIFQLA